MREEPMRIALHPRVHDKLENLRAGWQIARPGLTYSMVIEFLLSNQSWKVDEIRAFDFISKEVGRPTTPRLQSPPQTQGKPTDTEAELGSKEADSDGHPG